MYLITVNLHIRNAQLFHTKFQAPPPIDMFCEGSTGTHVLTNCRSDRHVIVFWLSGEMPGDFSLNPAFRWR